MSDELTYSIAMKYTKDGDQVILPADVISVDVAGSDIVSGTMDLTTSYEYIPLGDVVTGGLCKLKNIGSDTICIREDLTGPPRFALKPGEESVVRLDSTGFGTPAAKALTSTSRLKYFLIDA